MNRFINRNRNRGNQPRGTYGLLAKFNNQEDLITAARRTYETGYRRFDTFSPYPVPELAEAMHLRSSPLPFVILAGGIIGMVGAFFMMTFATVVDYPINIGGRPLFSWPAYIPITFELTVLFASFAGILGMFIVTRFPMPYHPIFNSDDFYLSIEASDPMYNLERTRSFLENLGSAQVTEVEA
jgi:Alternative complex III, ActD subunit